MDRSSVRSGAAVVCLGELLVDLVALEAGASIERALTFRKAAGGAPANVAVGLARLGVQVGFIGKVGADPFGRFLRQTLVDEGVDVRGLCEDPRARTPIAFVAADDLTGGRFLLYRTGTADTRLARQDLDLDLIAGCQVFHFGSVSLTDEPSRTATLEAAHRARAAGALVSFDPNVRRDLWGSEQAARAAIRDAIALADLVKLSTDELELVADTADPAEACRAIRAHGPSLVVVTLGADGCRYETAEQTGRLPGLAVEPVDVTGAGDAFVAGLLAGLADLSAAPGCIPGGTALEGVLRVANAAGALTTLDYGAIPALPRRDAVERLLDCRRLSQTGEANGSGGTGAVRRRA
jgi:fructokinase